MRVVVTGATGNVGTSVVRAPAADPQVDEIVGVARRLPSWRPPRTRWISADVERDDLAALFANAGAGALVHASSVGVYSPGPKDRRVDESWPREGVASSFYARHKAAAERALDPRAGGPLRVRELLTGVGRRL
jgi:nucleoside-diphosphate-sugar epimerase